MVLRAKLLKDGYYWFFAEFFWEPGNDDVARKRLIALFDRLPDGIDEQTLVAYYLTGDRRAIFVGQTNSAMELQKFTTAIMYDTFIEGRVFHAVEAHEIKSMYEKAPEMA